MEAGNCPCIKLVKVLLKKLQNDLFKVLYVPWITAYESCRLMLKDGVPQDEKEKTFGANIYDLLNNHFFMTEFVGKFAAKKIDDIIEKINNALENNDTQNIEKLQSEINIIGDDFIRYKLNERIEPLLSNHKKALLKAELAQKEEELNILKQDRLRLA